MPADVMLLPPVYLIALRRTSGNSITSVPNTLATHLAL
jgi:hypothetical protein